ncbi:CU044_5270 family protein [Actinomadura sp. WMMB 499]|uniref:CU044_5270 family protein n=1 Tax=Actinomadura sp. WMMB 499 TaxID=1219491 RepID=UPI001245A698|nr:CU044_5270 family protein [Actinomadura sp. WMMB 499]QFG22748.1 hypothetical protein F7P10_18115 [Actinomadura sp. WMMB 499]
MDDDLRLLAATLTKPEPSADTVERRRHQLQNEMRRPARARRRSRRPLIAIGTAAATAAAAVAIVVTDGGSPAPPSGDRTTVAQMSGPQVLLAAATVAESQPKTSGTYWHIEQAGRPGTPMAGTVETWTTVDGRKWVRIDDGKLTRRPGRHPIALRGTDLELADIEKLPTTPEELKKALLEWASRGTWTEAQITQESNMVYWLSSLLAELPAPPKVRAAALRALATLPNVENRGKVPGGQSLVFAGDGGGTKLVIDLENATVNGEGYADINGTEEGMGAITTTAGWTDEPPR